MCCIEDLHIRAEFGKGPPCHTHFRQSSLIGGCGFYTQRCFLVSDGGFCRQNAHRGVAFFMESIPKQINKHKGHDFELVCVVCTADYLSSRMYYSQK